MRIVRVWCGYQHQVSYRIAIAYETTEFVDYHGNMVTVEGVVSK